MEPHYHSFWLKVFDSLLRLRLHTESLLNLIELLLSGVGFMGLYVRYNILLMLTVGIVRRMSEYIGIRFVLIV